MSLNKYAGGRFVRSFGLGAAFFLGSDLGLAQTWQGARTTPSLGEVVAVDATGESGWLYGFEDLAGDGVTFNAPEQSIDARTAYAATDTKTFWGRIYFSGTGAPGANLSGYFFIDQDRNTRTGGTAVAPEINAVFTTDPTPGGYDFVVEIPGSATQARLWQYQSGARQYTSIAVVGTQAAAESGVDLDPIRIGGNQHGYLQGAVELARVGLTSACGANLFVRTANATASIGESDVNVGAASSCVPANNNGVPVILTPATGCVSNSECPYGGICQAGQCVLPRLCVTSADCPSGDTCTADGRCVPQSTAACSPTVSCTGGLVCVSGQCTACTLGGAQCPSGQVCSPAGVCIADVGTSAPCSGTASCSPGLICASGQCAACTSTAQCGAGETCTNGRCVGPAGAGGSGNIGGQTGLAPGEAIQGGAFKCAVSTRTVPAPWGLVSMIPLFFAVRRRSRRAR